MAAMRPSDDWYRQRMRARRVDQHAQFLALRQERLSRTLEEVALGSASPLFTHLRASLAEADPSFRARMEAMVNEA